MPKVRDLLGQRFGRLLVKEVFHKKTSRRRRYYRCLCDCGNVREVMPHNLISGDIKSCGCFNQEARRSRWTTHGLSRKPGYFCWRNMMSRCYNPADINYEIYGGRGISVCERWRDVENFFADVGSPPTGMTLDRINTDGHYEPDNCRWVTPKEQCRNKRNNINLTIDGRTQCVSAWAEEMSVPKARIYRRLSEGWPEEVALKSLNKLPWAKARGVLSKSTAEQEGTECDLQK